MSTVSAWLSPTLSSCQTELSHICSLHSFEDEEMSLANQPAACRGKPAPVTRDVISHRLDILSASQPPSVASLTRLAHCGYLTHHSQRPVLGFKLLCWLCCLYLFCLYLALSISLCAALCLTGYLFLSRSMVRLTLLWACSFY